MFYTEMVVVNADMAPSIRLYIIFIKIWRKKITVRINPLIFMIANRTNQKKKPTYFILSFPGFLFYCKSLFLNRQHV